MDHDALGVILDVTPGDHEGFERQMLEGMGHTVEVCHGPGEHETCPLLEHGTCGEVNRAHGIVFKLDLEREYHRRILEQYKKTLPTDMPNLRYCRSHVRRSHGKPESLKQSYTCQTCGVPRPPYQFYCDKHLADGEKNDKPLLIDRLMRKLLGRS